MSLLYDNLLRVTEPFSHSIQIPPTSFNDSGKFIGVFLISIQMVSSGANLTSSEAVFTYGVGRSNKKGLKMLPVITKPTIPSNYVRYFFDLELVNQFNFTGLEPSQEPIMNNLIRAMTSSKNCGIVVQFLFTRSLNWNKIAKLAASKLTMYLRSVEKGKTKHFISGFSKNFTPTIYAETIPMQVTLEILGDSYHFRSR